MESLSPQDAKVRLIGGCTPTLVPLRSPATKDDVKPSSPFRESQQSASVWLQLIPGPESEPTRMPLPLHRQCQPPGGDLPSPKESGTAAVRLTDEGRISATTVFTQHIVSH